ncbi:MAG: exonuclease SbcCD subunit D [Promethearchaeota archaeon]
MKIKFAHISDVHLGAWRNEQINELGFRAFEKAVEFIINESVDFVIISGDLYDVSNPRVEVIDIATKELKRLKDHQISVYGIMGSHDFSPSDKSMIRPLISAGLFTDLSSGKFSEDGKLQLNFFQDPKTKVKLTGLRARKRSLEINDYKILDRESLKHEKGPKVFILHTMLSELKPKEYKEMESAPKSLLPEDFDYYAAGHLHKTVPERLKDNSVIIEITKKNNIVYPGCLFPTDFREFESIKFGGFCIITGEINGDKLELKIKYHPIKVIGVENIFIDCTNKSVDEVNKKLKNQIIQKDFTDKIVTIRIFGPLSSGKSYEIKNNEIIQKFKDKGAYEVLINKSALSTMEYPSVSVKVGESNEEIEDNLIKEHINKIKIGELQPHEVEKKIHQLLTVLGTERHIGTKVMDYNMSLKQSFSSIFEIDKSKERKI